MKNPLKDKPVRLGQIKNSKLEKYGDNICWNLDKTIAIFLRDVLRRYADTSQGFPDCYDENWDVMTTEQWEQRDREKDGYATWVSHIRDIADKIDFYLKDPEELLEQEDRDFLESYYKKYPVKFEKTTDNYYTLAHHAPKEEENRYRDIIFNKQVIAEKNQLTAIREALHDLAKIFPSLWD